ncbi:MAG: ribulose-phosphate 3-epimerase [Rickettsiales bacterium]|jgi:ribulose-phosphate 3-epimerase|nr:ribulose-phosphate 3-epimerase [Rickettsiales bacterium]
MKLSVGIWQADVLDIGATLRKIDESTADAVHFDIMDGIFAPDITHGPKIIADLRKLSKKTFEAHLMTIDPAAQAARFAEAGADEIIVHAESDGAMDAMRIAKSLGLKAGIAIRLETKIEKLKPYLKIADKIQIMTAATGKSGQPFFEKSLDRIARAKENFAGEIYADGGINYDTAKLCEQAGATGIVSGSFITRQKDFAAAAGRLKNP